MNLRTYDFLLDLAKQTWRGCPASADLSYAYTSWRGTLTPERLLLIKRALETEPPVLVAAVASFDFTSEAAKKK